MPEHDKSDAWYMIELLGKQNRRLFVLAMALLVAWLLTIGGFVWYPYQYDFETYYVDAENGPANYIGNDGDIYNGNSDSAQENP